MGANNAQTRGGRPLRERRTDPRGFWNHHRMAWDMVWLGVHAPRFFSPALLWEKTDGSLGHPCPPRTGTTHRSSSAVVYHSMFVRDRPMIVVSAIVRQLHGHHGNRVPINQHHSAVLFRTRIVHVQHMVLRLFKLSRTSFGVFVLGLWAAHVDWTLAAGSTPLQDRPLLIIGLKGLGAGLGWFKVGKPSSLM